MEHKYWVRVSACKIIEFISFYIHETKISLSDYIHISIFLEEPTDNNIHFMGYIYTICTLPMYYHNYPKRGIFYIVYFQYFIIARILSIYQPKCVWADCFTWNGLTQSIYATMWCKLFLQTLQFNKK